MRFARLGNGGGGGSLETSRETSRELEPRNQPRKRAAKPAAKRGANSRREIEARNEPPVVPTEVAPRSPPGRRVGARRLLSSRPFAPQNLRHFEGRSDSPASLDTGSKPSSQLCVEGIARSEGIELSFESSDARRRTTRCPRSACSAGKGRPL